MIKSEIRNPKSEIVIGPLAGLKNYRLGSDGLHHFYVPSLVARVERAGCILSGPDRHRAEAPYRDCTCGLYVYRDVPVFGEWHERAYRFTVWAAVLLWGRAIEHRGGWRAEHVRIEGLLARPGAERILSVLAESWRIPLVILGPHPDPEIGYGEFCAFAGAMLRNLRVQTSGLSQVA